MRISHFNNEQLNEIRNIWSIKCENIQFLKNNEKCSIHNIKHNKLPDLRTWDELKSLYPTATLDAWGEAFYTSKESIRLLNNSLIKESGDSYQEWNLEKYNILFGEEPYFELFYDFFHLFVAYPNKGKDSILNFLGIQKNYFEYWINNNENLSREYIEAKKKREDRKYQPIHLKCYRCKQTKPIREFGNDKSTQSGKSNTCKTCNREGSGKKQSLEKRLTEKRCDRCQKLKHIKKFTHTSNEGEVIKNDICSSCYQNRRLTSSKEKMIKAGIKNKNQECIICENLLPIEEFYLRRRTNYSFEEETWLSKECKPCVRSELKKYPKFKESIKSKWDRESLKMGSNDYLYFKEFLDMYLSNLKYDSEF